MALRLTLPMLEKHATVKDHIVSILSNDWPLTVKKLHLAIKKKYGKNVTYQAAYKSAHELMKEMVIKKSGEGYQISEDWVKSLHKFTEIVESNYFTKERLTAIGGLKDSKSEGNINILKFQNYFDTEKYIYYLLKHSIATAKIKEICIHHVHEWAPLFYMRAEYNKGIAAMHTKIYRLCRGDTATDKWCCSFYRQLNQKAKCNASCADVAELIVFEDTVIQVFLPSAIRDSMDSILKKAKTIADVDVKKLIKEALEKDTTIEVVISKDPEISRQIREKTLSYFK